MRPRLALLRTVALRHNPTSVITKDSRTNLVVTLIAAASTLTVGVLGYLGSVRSAEIQTKRDALAQPLPSSKPDSPTAPPVEEPALRDPGEIEAAELKARQAVRAGTGVQELAPLENELPLGRVSSGRFGFAFDAPLFHPESVGEQLRLERVGDNDYQFEIHKTPKDSVLIVGFMTPPMLDALRKPDANARYQLFSQMTDSTQVAVALPIASLTFHDSRKVDIGGRAAALIEFSSPSGVSEVWSSN